jgi:hypothetical protein
MFTHTRSFLVTLAAIVISVGSLYGQEESFSCSFSQNLTAQDSAAMLEGAITLQDTSLRIGILFVQFADYATNINARGSVGWNSELPSDTVTIEKKYRYHHFWEMYFSRNSYIDIDPDDPELHPDANSHPSH